jgi:maleate isomerase
MTSVPRIKIGFISNSNRQGSHYDDLIALAPPEFELSVQALGTYRSSLSELAGKAEWHVTRSAEIVAERGWKGVAITGAPMEVQNPGFASRLREAIDVPVTTALGASITALRSLGVRRVMLLTPFDERLKGMLRDFLANEGIDAALPEISFPSPSEGARMTPEDVYNLAKDSVASASGVEGIYFQGAPLNPLDVIERLEADMGIPVVASNPAMLWHVASLLGYTSSVPNAGRLLREWPDAA